MAADKLYQANPDFIVRQVAGEFVAVPIGKAAHDFNAAMILNEGGAFLWKRLEQQSQTKEELTVALVAEYGITQDVARTDASAFVDKAVPSSMVVCA